MNCVRREAPGILHYGALHFAPDCLVSTQEIDRIVRRDLRDSGIDFDELKQNMVILDFRAEGQSDFDIVNLVAYLRSNSVQQVAAIFNSVVDVSKLDYPALSLPTYLVNFAGWFNELEQHPASVETDCDFLCLMRRPSQARAELASRLLAENLDLRLSFGGMCQPQELTEYESWFPKHQLPLLIDGLLIREFSNNREHSATSPLIRNCAVNIVVESGDQTSPNTWKGCFITEKTFKAFGLQQLPIWWAVPSLVAEVRNLGFDIFDDIIDHKYDSMVNHGQRLDAVVAQIQLLNALPLSDLRADLKSRLAANYELLSNMVHSQNQNFQTLVSRLKHE